MNKNNYQDIYNEYLQSIESRIEDYVQVINPEILYEPFKYIVSIGGKRIRPVLNMIACGAVGGEPEDAINTGVALEILHNFTLVHDDIMDKSPLRRNHQTVHTKWNEPIAIITGDVMVGYAYKLLPSVSEHNFSEKILSSFTRGLIEVCEGQAYDMEFNEKQDVSIDDYLLMITKKTAMLLETSAVIGGYVGNANQEQIDALDEYAKALGLAFQIQDDLLDITANQDKLGKTVGEDIVDGKKTFLIIKALEKAKTENDKKLLNKFYRENGLGKEYVNEIKDMFIRLNILKDAENEADRYFQIARESLIKLPKNKYNDMLEWLILKLNNRNY